MDEPIAYLCENAVGHKYFRWKKPQSIFKPIALYTAPPQREWQGLTDEELLDLADMAYANDLELLQTLQAKLKEKNGI
jgi:DNA-binding PucR family transcriptional regulator